MLATNTVTDEFCDRDCTNRSHRFKSEVGEFQVRSASQPGIDAWQHIAAVWDSGQLKIYVNGQFDGVINTGHPVPNSFPPMDRLQSFWCGPNWRGAIDEVRIWAVARTQEQIQSSMNRYLCGDERGLRAYWSLDEGQGEKLRDTIGHSNGIISGPEWVPGVELARSEGCQDKFHRR